MTDEQLDVVLDAVNSGEGWPWMKFTFEQVEQAIKERISKLEEEKAEAVLYLAECQQRRPR